MLEFRKKNRIRRLMYSPFTLFVLFIVFVISAHSLWKVYNKNILSLENLERDKMELQKILDREKNLASSLEYLKTEQGIEDEIRSKFRVVKDGEKVAVIIEDKAATSSLSISTTTHGFWYRLFH